MLFSYFADRIETDGKNAFFVPVLFISMCMLSPLLPQVMYLIPVTLTICVIAAFQIPAFTERQNLGAISLLLVLFG